MRIALTLLFASIGFTSLAHAQLPSFYRQVAGMVWVVKDTRPVVEGWTKLGLTDVAAQPARPFARWTRARLARMNIDFFEPLAPRGDLFGGFLKRRADGVFALVYRVPSEDVLQAEIARLRTAGVAVMMDVKLPRAGRNARYVFFDTEREGKYAIALVHDPAAEQEPASAARRISQYAFVVRDAAPVSAYWKKLGFPELSITRPALTELYFRGKPASFEQELGWQRHGVVPFEWCVPPRGAATVYAEFLKEHGEGLQHIAFNVADMDKAIAEHKALGFEAVQGGGWGEEGKPGSGRFAYVDTDRIGGILIELLWNYRAPQ